MSRKIAFQQRALDEYHYWMKQDKKTIKRIKQLICDIDKNGYDGIGHPEPLQYELSGWYSRKIDKVNRLVYRLRDDIIEIAQCRGHYDDK